jgi:DNA-binding CsgD family transcriptional regulator
MRIRRLKGEAKADLFALVLEPFRNRDSVRVAARRYSLTKREHEILTLILEGAIAQEIAAALHISENTVQGYFKRLLKKTNSRNRAAMVANVLEWNRNTGRAPAPPEEQAKTDTDPRRRIIGKS